MLYQIMRVGSSAYYDWWKNEADRKVRAQKWLVVKQRIRVLFIQQQRKLGYRSMTALLRKEGFVISHHTVRRLMKEMGLYINTRKYTVYRPDHRITPCTPRGSHPAGSHPAGSHPAGQAVQS